MFNINVLVVLELDSFKHQISKLMRLINAPTNFTYHSKVHGDVKFNVRMVTPKKYSQILKDDKIHKLDLKSFPVIIATDFKDARAKFLKYFKLNYGIRVVDVTPSGNVEVKYIYDWFKPKLYTESNGIPESIQLAIKEIDRKFLLAQKSIELANIDIMQLEKDKSSLLFKLT